MTFWTRLRCRLFGHPERHLALGPGGWDGFHVATCQVCWARWVTHEHRISDHWIDGLEAQGADSLTIGRLIRSQRDYDARRANHEARNPLAGGAA